MGTITRHNLLSIVTLTIILYIYSVQNKYAVSDLANVSNFTSTLVQLNENLLTGDMDILMCEKVWDNMIASRTNKFGLKLNPAHFVIEDYLEIVSENKRICDLGKMSVNETSSVRILIAIVNSARNHFKERQDIRDSWGSIKEYPGGWHVRTVFVVGQSDFCLTDKKNATMRNYVKREDLKLNEEHEKHGDLVIGSFTDTYRNNTYKLLTGFKFVVETCSNADFIVKTDDDTFVNIPMILDKRTEELGDKGNKKKTVNDIYCKKKQGGPIRCRSCRYGKWFTTRQEWASNNFPAYCPGWGIAMSMEWVRNIFAVRNFGGFLWMDDVFVTGKLREVAEKEFGRKANILDVWKDTWMGKPEKGICSNVTKKNIKTKKKQLVMYAHLERNEKLGKLLKCLTDISLARNLPFSM